MPNASATELASRSRSRSHSPTPHPILSPTSVGSRAVRSVLLREREGSDRATSPTATSFQRQTGEPLRLEKCT
ncbi:hypothetical protein K1719_012768 [Acacia pycnantha]|nr:hypothetical protein K1719_012768 [Acacia pycnantha]